MVWQEFEHALLSLLFVRPRGEYITLNPTQLDYTCALIAVIIIIIIITDEMPGNNLTGHIVSCYLCVYVAYLMSFGWWHGTRYRLDADSH